MHTSFLSPGRAATPDLASAAASLVSNNVIRELVDLQPDPVALVTEHRQIVLANTAFATAAGSSRDGLVGRRIGEALACVNAWENPAGCGTSDGCLVCGLGRAVYETQRTKKTAVRECRIRRQHADADVLVTTSPIAVNGEALIAVSLRDITDRNRRAVLERALFETSYGDEIDAIRDLARAERRELTVTRAPHPVNALLDRAADMYRRLPAAQGIRIEVDHTADERVTTDADLFLRAFSRLLKNAIEASGPGETVRVGYVAGTAPAFRVWNAAVMPVEVQRQIFQRSFTTKGEPGRGVGTYAARLIVEQYLGGHISFTSARGDGTEFRIELPVRS